MSNTADIVEVWESEIWNDPDITSITSKIYNYEILQNSEKQEIKIRENEQINFCVFLVKRSPLQYEMTRGRKYIYEVEIAYYREQDEDGAAHLAVIEFFETLDTLVKENLSYTWGGTVSTSRPGENVLEISTENYSGVDVLVGRVSYAAEKVFNE